jgi:large subunit ribosomal protein L4
LGIDTTVLVATAGSENYAYKSARNLAGVKVIPANLLNVADLLSYQGLLMTKDAVQKAEELWEQDRSTKMAKGK